MKRSPHQPRRASNHFIMQLIPMATIETRTWASNTYIFSLCLLTCFWRRASTIYTKPAGRPPLARASFRAADLRLWAIYIRAQMYAAAKRVALRWDNRTPARSNGGLNCPNWRELYDICALAYTLFRLKFGGICRSRARTQIKVAREV